MSFVDLYDDLGKYIDCPKKRWRYCCRVKRGRMDTQLKGGFYRDQHYFIGAIEVLLYRKTLDFPGLLCGKIDFDSLDTLSADKNLNYTDIITPLFMRNMHFYYHALDLIAEANNID